MANDRVVFTPSSADRIARVVRTVEAGDRNARPYVAAPRAASSAKVFRVCTFTGSWIVDGVKTVTFRNQTATPNTVAAYNLFGSIFGTTATTDVKNCAIARDGTAWYLIAAECS